MYAGGGIPDRQDAVMLPNGVSGLTMLELRKGVYAAVSSWPEDKNGDAGTQSRTPWKVVVRGTRPRTSRNNRDSVPKATTRS
ncbi:hypothetical protein N7501_002991 [Penicillium viridicatum]|nr:hypothetical protein N7501_002991 [Penicillium viridicatum]